jgi:cytochrome c nitrite reductase small subunit
LTTAQLATFYDRVTRSGLNVPRKAVRDSGYTGYWLVALSVSLGLLGGVGVYTFRYAEGLSYFSTDPAACVNCHIMRPQYNAWLTSSHHTAATCIDCHLPHTFIEKYLAKAENGYRHSKEFTAQTFAEPIVIQPRAREILQANCIACHVTLVHDMTSGHTQGAREVSCVHCHVSVGHGERAGLGGPLTYLRQRDVTPEPTAEMQP